MLMRGTKDYPMHRHPFTLLKIVISDEQGKINLETHVAHRDWSGA